MERQSSLNLDDEFDHDDGRRRTETQTVIQMLKWGRKDGQAATNCKKEGDGRMGGCHEFSKRRGC